MKYLWAIFIMAYLSGCASVNALPSAPMNSSLSEAESIVAGNTAFSVDLYKQLQETDGNIFISPASITTAFGLVYPGARNETAAEIARVMHFNLSPKEFPLIMEGLLADLQIDDEGRVLAINNSVWFDQTRVVDEEYLALTAKYYKAKENKVDFKSSPDLARESINGWVEERTNDRIQKLLSPSNITKETRFVLVNTIYLDADWQSSFKASSTKNEPFELIGRDETVVPMMSQTKHFRHWQNKKLQMVELPYRGGEISMVVLLPKRSQGIESVEDILAAQLLEGWLAALSASAPVEVDLKLPKLKVEKRYELKEALTLGLGMGLSFSNNADFTGMIDPGRQPDGRGVKIGDVVHQTFLKVDEAGTEAVAATAIDGIQVTSAPSDPTPPVLFHADHPFLFLLKNNKTGAILFLGRMVDPR